MMRSILVIGATGYVGRNLVPRLIEMGYHVRLLVRSPQKMDDRAYDGAEIYKGDLQEPHSLPHAFKDIDVVYYLAHAMSTGKKFFEGYDRSAAWNVMTLSQLYDVQRLIYLGGLGNPSAFRSPHLRSRHEVGDILRAGRVPITEFRAAIIIGSGSTSFEIIRHLAQRLPVMICPKWIYVKTQPIAIRDVIQYLLESIEKPDTAGKTYEIGGPNILTYGEMILRVSSQLGLRRYLIPVPVLSPALSSYWVSFITPVHPRIARVLIESLRCETICKSRDASEDFSVRPIEFEEAVHQALRESDSLGVTSQVNVPKSIAVLTSTNNRQ